MTWHFFFINAVYNANEIFHRKSRTHLYVMIILLLLPPS